MRTHSAHCRAVLLLIAFAVCISAASGVRAAIDSAPDRSVPIFGMGQAVLDPQDNARSQQQAIQDLMGQALIQAMGKYLSPTQIGTQFSAIQKKILANSSKYIDSYQVFSETPTGGVYRVLGQVNVSMDVLRKDLEEAGFPVPQAGTGTAAGDISDSRQSQSAGPATGQPADGPVAGSAQTVDTPKPSASRGLTVTKKEILWAVPEKWEQEWVIPTGKRDTQSLFMQGMMRELDSYNYTLYFPEPGSVKIDFTGNIPQTQIIRLAQGLGIQEAVVGSMALKQESNKPPRLVAFLRVLKVGQGKVEGEINRELPLEHSNQEGAFSLATIIAPQLDKLLGGEAESKSRATSPSQDQAPAAGDTPSPDTPTRWTVSFPSAQFSYWKEMERVLREKFRGMQVSGLEMGVTDGSVRLDGIDGSFISRMNGTSLPTGAMVRIDSYSTETGEIKVSFTPPAPKAEQQR